MRNKERCKWVDLNNPLYIKYHDTAWGVPVHSDRLLFEMLTLEGAQAGLSWSTILAKREGYRNAFECFDVEVIARYGDKKIQKLLKDEGIIRNHLKIRSTIRNAKVFIEIQKKFDSFDKYIWGFVGGKTIQNNFKESKDLPAETKLSEEISQDLKKRGMNFVGPTIVYAFMQAIGMVNDHEKGCFRHQELT
ncbi:DNA-3-methyladenine glycosylase I [bacterium]|jgi:DNA-3-methyladenine glycosylase I|nr:DNA-3-methyladenine glycosylase I [bacterium]MBT4251309.1 DNA-3-methyladenine glycosylase I [bacterium]MBT4598310.1 DNA-3-methyladenine glycosylase I [bacterium]MBT6754143.1 DNA-3-methyladenine glycosylase I [bacterium]MBT7037963.1 DNA-3-methyladenine glycosylase I [bacterium]